MSDQYDRREFLRRAGLGASAAAVMAAGLPRPVAAADRNLAPFLHGVASGDPLSDRVIIWTRVTPPPGHDGKPIKVKWTVAGDPELGSKVNSGSAKASAEKDWCVKIDVTGLAPYTYYYYAFTALGQQSSVARTKTAPAGDETRHLRYGLVSCSNYTGGYFNAYARLAERDDLDVILHLGDYIYEYGNGNVEGDRRYGPDSMRGVRDHEPDTEQVTLADYRARHGNYKKDPDLRRLHQLFPFVTTWDDHESTDNSWKDGANNHQPDTEGDWATRKAASMQAYDEWMPIRSTGDPAIIYRHLQWGNLVDLILLDTRLEGRDEQLQYPGDQGEAIGALGVRKEADDPDRRMISDRQMAWFQDRMANSTAQWKLLAQQVVVAQWNAGAVPHVPDGAPVNDFPQLIRSGGNALNPDAWDGYTHQRDQLFDAFEQSDGVVVLTGDVHSSWAFDLSRDPENPMVYNPLSGDGSLGVEFVVPAVSSPVFAHTFGDERVSGPVIETGMRTENLHLKWVDTQRNGYAVLDVTPDGVQADWYFLDTVLEPSDGESLAASWRTNAGTRNLVQAQAEAQAKQAPEDIPGPRPAPVALADRDAEPAQAGSGTGGLLAGAVAAAGAFVIRRRQDQGEKS